MTAAAVGSHVAFTEAGSLRVLTPNQILTLQEPWSELDHQGLPVTSSPNERKLLALSSDANLIVQGNINCGMDGVAWLCSNQEIQVWSVDLSQQLASLEDTGSAEFLSALSMSADNTLVARSLCGDVETMAIADGYSARCGADEVHLWSLLSHMDADTLESVPPFATLTGFTQIPIELAFSPSVDGQQHLLAADSPSGDGLQFWSVNPAANTAIALGSADSQQQIIDSSPSAIIFNDAGTLLALSVNGQIQLWG